MSLSFIGCTIRRLTGIARNDPTAESAFRRAASKCMFSLAAFSLIFLAGGCSGEPPKRDVIRPVRVVRVGEDALGSGRALPGIAAAIDAVEMSFRVSGPLVAFDADEIGKSVKKGELLAQVDPRDFDVRLRDAQANLAKARSELTAMTRARPEEIEQLKAAVSRAEAAVRFARAEVARSEPLAKSNTIAKAEFELIVAKKDLAEADLVQAQESLKIGEQGARKEDIDAKQAAVVSLQAALKTAQDQLNDTKLLAPFDGSVAATYAENFELVQARQPILRLLNTAELKMKVDVPEQSIARVPQVTEVEVTFNAFPDSPIPARVKEIGSEASSTTRTYPVILAFTPPPGLPIRPGMTGFARGKGAPPPDAADPSQKPTFIVPASAVLLEDGKRSVWVVDEKSKKVSRRSVELQDMTQFGLRITGVESGELVVSAGAHYLAEGQQVRLEASAPSTDKPSTDNSSAEASPKQANAEAPR
ncbi:MAG: efflux RND transporter periplasmic adaptor subunit [Pirellulales bacterium]